MKPLVLDSSALVAFCDPDDPCHPSASRQVSRSLQEGHPLVVPVSILAEVLTTDSSWPDVGLPVHVLGEVVAGEHDHIT